MAPYIEVEGSQFYYEVAGKGQPLVWVHAGFVDSGMWDAQWETFKAHYQIIRLDMRGYGKSDPAHGPVSRRDDLYALLRQLNIAEAHLVGCSLGGEAVLDLMLEHPEMVLSLVLVSTTPSGFELEGEPPAILLEMIGAMQQEDTARTSELQVQLWLDGPFRDPSQVDTQMRQRVLAMNRIAVDNGTWAIADMQPLNPLDPPAISRLEAVQVPTLVVVGALDHPEIMRAAEVMTSRIAGAKKVVLNDTAHVPNMELSNEFNQAVLEFLQTRG